MFTSTILLSVLCMFYSEVLTETPKNCNHCVDYYQCEEAMVLTRNNHSIELANRLRAAYCGKSTYGVRSVPKICCSHFQAVEEGDKLKDHPNYNLLPESPDCGEYNEFRIMGGRVAALYEFPWMVLISYRSGYSLSFDCAGTLINPRYVLTAAHCLKNTVIAGVRLGELDIYSKNDCQFNICESHIQDKRIAEIIIHEKYDGQSKHTHDIGLLRLAREVSFEHKNIGTICLPKTMEQRNFSITYKSATVAGWGLTELSENSAVLRKVEIPIYNHSECFQFHSRILSDDDPEDEHGQFCAGIVNKDSCTGDSGGPLMIKFPKTSYYVQYGIVSQGPMRCGSSIPGVYTNVSKYMKWILDHIKP